MSDIKLPDYQPDDWRMPISTMAGVMENICEDRMKDFCEQAESPRPLEYLKAFRVHAKLREIQLILGQKIA